PRPRLAAPGQSARGKRSPGVPTMTTLPPPANASVEALLGQIADEFMERRDRGEQPSIEEYAARYPAIAAQLRGVLSVLGLLRRPDVAAGLTDADPNLGALLGDFRVLREIGRGGMAVVYEATQLSRNRKVALKVLPFAGVL